jgi:hypothetical protein
VYVLLHEEGAPKGVILISLHSFRLLKYILLLKLLLIICKIFDSVSSSDKRGRHDVDINIIKS